MSSESTQKAQASNVVFGVTKGYRNVVLNWASNPKGEFVLYGDAYHAAGKKLLEAYAASRGYDLDSVPIVFLYRQALELNLKSAIIHGNSILRLEGRPEVADEEIFRSHSLIKLFVAVEKIIESMGWKDGYAKGCIENFEDCRRIIEDFNKIDPQSYAFRYPIDTKGKGSLSHHFAFDVHLFAERLDPLIELLSGTAMVLDDMYDGMREAMAEAGQAAMEYSHDVYNDGDYDPPDYEPPDYDHEDHD
jgi:hypothetical protein